MSNYNDPNFDKDLYWKRRNTTIPGLGRLRGQVDIAADTTPKPAKFDKHPNGDIKSTKEVSKKAKLKNTKRARKELSND